MTRTRAAARRLLIRRLIGQSTISGQEELVRQLGRHGHRVTQTTVSRDLTALGIEKVEGKNGDTTYALPPSHRGPATNDSEALTKMLRAFALEIDRSRNLVVIKTPPGSASPIATALDDSPPAEVMGTVAGDDTVLVVARSDNGAAKLVRTLQQLLGG